MSEISDLIPIDADWVARVIAKQAPQWAQLPLRCLDVSGTDNVMFRLGDALVVRMPRRVWALALLQKELDWLAHLQGLPLAVPNLRYRGRAGTDHSLDFGILDRIEGEAATGDHIADWRSAAQQLAAFLGGLHGTDTSGAPLAGESNSHRGVALEMLDSRTKRAIDAVSDEIDVTGAHTLWETACAETFDGPPVWLHGDLKADNMIARGGALHGVIDWGLSAVGDPAADYSAAWSWLDPMARETFRESLDLENGDWLRAKGWGLYGAVIALCCYRGGKNEALCRQSRQTLLRLGLLL